MYTVYQSNRKTLCSTRPTSPPQSQSKRSPALQRHRCRFHWRIICKEGYRK
ncbi:hypothetical protein DPMN_025728 [Dreissena polymorpha]|uniref:Uncharacterized protein n=1 Tax=Dreissena polymorpha TaxID=45954 RepID=A0A9D4RDX1_DREPO|nr:hypothetical protein DPMN_025728 [Dreissena polymorpha]